MLKRSKHKSLLGGVALAVLAGASAFAQQPVELTVERVGAATRLILDYPDALASRAPSAQADIEYTVLIATLSEPIAADVSDLPDMLGGLAARARLDADGRTLRLALNRASDVQTSSSYDWVAIDIAPRGAEMPDPVVSPREREEIAAAAAAAEAAEAAALAQAEADAEPPVPAVPVDIRVGQSTEYTRIEMLWPEAVDYALRQSGDVAELRFSQPGVASLSRINGSPPDLLQSMETVREGDEWLVRLNVDPDVRVRAWDDGPRVTIDLINPDTASAAALLQQIAELIPEASEPPAETSRPALDETGRGSDDPGSEPPADPFGPIRLTPEMTSAEEYQGNPAEIEPVSLEGVDPVPEGGIVHGAVTEFSGDLSIEFDWAGPVGAAVFRRGEAVWIVFDAAAELNMAELAHRERRHVGRHRIYRGEDYVAARLEVPATTQAEARLQDDQWTLVLSERIDSPPRPVTVRRDARRGRMGRIIVGLSDPREVRWVEDPIVGDRIGVVTAGGPIEGLASRRAFVGGALLPSAHGAAVEAMADDLTISVNNAGAIIGRPEGLNLTPSSSGARAQGDNAVLANISSPALMDFDAWRGDNYFADDWAERQRAAAMENSSDARIALGRFLLANNLAPEALGMLYMATHDEPQLEANAHIRALRGVASYMMHRLDDAEEYLSDASLSNDPAADMWRGMIAVHQERWEEARRRLESGEDAAYFYPPVWQARFEAARARAALEVGDFAAAEQHLFAIEAGEPDPQTELDALYVQARLAEAREDLDTAISLLEQLEASGNPLMEARALYELIRMRLEAGQIDRNQAIDDLENLRFRWRGDSIESDTIRQLGQLYVASGEFGLGLETMALAQTRFAGHEIERRIYDDMNSIFRRLFLEGEADRMDPVEAVALFYEYQHLAPIGTEGDRMIRRLADRLIAFDLLDPAAELLQHQVDNRLREPIARARVATDLAVIYLMDHRYEDALNTIRRTRVAGLPRELIDERYLLEARALSELGRPEAALDLIADDLSDAAARLRADVAWEARDWPSTGRRLERLLGNRYQSGSGLTPSEQNDVMRAAIAYSLAQDVASAQRLGERYSALMARTDQSAAFELLTDDNATPGNVRFSDLAGQIAGIDTLQAFMEPFRERFSGGGA
ncbi:MAG: hypothetical protein GYB36_08385 [Alphaproteobacteria bacterium]|nr:hypothetical protein [Alphaproteobacteria bacterium]